VATLTNIMKVNDTHMNPASVPTNSRCPRVFCRRP